MTVKPLPAYVYAVVKAPGVVAANQFLSVFNPVSSGVVQLALALTVSSYSVSSTSATEPLTLFRTSSQSGGTLIDPTTVSKFNPLHPNTSMEVRTGATVVTAGLVLLGIPPVVSVGTGSTGNSFSTPPGGVLAEILPGTGVTFGTASGSTNQIWNIQYFWGEAS